MSTHFTMAAPIDYTTTDYTTNNIVHRTNTTSRIASAAFTIASPPSPSHSLKRRRQFEVDYTSDGDADDEEGASSDSDDEEDEDKENALPRKRLCLNLEDSPHLRAAELSSGRSSRASWSSDASSTYTLLTPPDSPRVVFRPLEIIKVEDEDEDEDDADLKDSALFASDIEGPPTSSDESVGSRGSVDYGNDSDVHYTDSEVEMKATTQHPLSFSSTEAEEESGSEEDYESEEEEYGDVEDAYEDRGVDEDEDYEGEDEDEYNEEGYAVVKDCVAVQVKSYPHYTGESGYDMFARHCVAGFSSEGGIVVSSAVFSSMMAAQSFSFEEEEEEL